MHDDLIRKYLTSRGIASQIIDGLFEYLETPRIADRFKDVKSFLVQHLPSGDAYYSEFTSAADAWDSYESDCYWVENHPEGRTVAREEFLHTMHEYTQGDILQAVAEGYGWPHVLGFIE